jgi:short-subunit dehydrogenase
MCIARALAARNVNVALVARSADALQQLASELVQTGVRAKPIAYDLSDLSRLDGLIDRAEAAVGPIDILVNNAGLDGVRVFTEESDDELEQMIRVNLTAPMLLTRKMVPRMMANRSGHVINIASLTGKSGMPYAVSYATSKSGLITFTHGLRAELAGTGVRASVIVPGFIAGEGMFAKHQADHRLRVSRLIGTSRPSQVADAVLDALLTDKAEIVVNPGPMRLIQAVDALAPGSVAWLQRRLGVERMLRAVATADRPQPVLKRVVLRSEGPPPQA